MEFPIRTAPALTTGRSLLSPSYFRGSTAEPLVSEACSTTKTIPEMGLEAGDALEDEPSCFKASSKDHPMFRMTQMQIIIRLFAAAASLLTLPPPKYSRAVVVGARPPEGKSEWLVGRSVETGAAGRDLITRYSGPLRTVLSSFSYKIPFFRSIVSGRIERRLWPVTFPAGHTIHNYLDLWEHGWYLDGIKTIGGRCFAPPWDVVSDRNGTSRLRSYLRKPPLRTLSGGPGCLSVLPY